MVVHPQSVVHSMVEFADGSTLAQASPPDMRLPIALGMTWPDRLPARRVRPGLDDGRSSWTFEPLDGRPSRPSTCAARPARAAAPRPAVLNAANEECVAAFLDGRLPFPGIVDTVAEVVATHAFRERPDLAEVLEAEEQARRRARELVGRPAQ